MIAQTKYSECGQNGTLIHCWEDAKGIIKSKTFTYPVTQTSYSKLPTEDQGNIHSHKEHKCL